MRIQLEPRDRRAAARTGAWIYLVSAVVVFVSNLLITDTSGTNGTRYITLSIPFGLLIFGALLAWPRFHFTTALLVITPLLGVFFVVFLDLNTQDASAGAQVALCLPVLFAASQLRILGALLTAVVSIAGDALVIWQVKPNGAGVLDLVDVSLVLLLMTGLLVQAGRRQDRLVALLESQASLDPLTGLVTRRVLDEAVLRALNTPSVHAGTALILVDVDHFKTINDTYGHPVGDDALVHIAKVLERRSRPDTLISRLGGDEIAVLLPGCSEAVARERAHEFLQAMQESPLLLPHDERLTISISLGVAHVPAGKRPLRELYAAADASLYEAKRAGRGRVGQAVWGQPMFVGPPRPDVSEMACDTSEQLVHGSLEV